MDSLTSPKTTLSLLKKYRVTARKALGQNFLVDQNILGKIMDAAEVTSDDVVLEVGAGTGVLTLALAVQAKTVVAVEFDRTLVRILNETLRNRPNIKVLALNVLQLDLNNLAHGVPRPNKMVSNLPYNIAIPALIHLLATDDRIGTYVVTLQEAVGKRIMAQPGSKNYGAVTLKIRYFCDTSIVAPVPRTVFLPQPKVDSVIVKLQRLARPRVRVRNPSLLFQTITAAFSHRRKTIANSLIADRFRPQDEIMDALQRSGIDATRRGETLTLEEFATLSEHFRS